MKSPMPTIPFRLTFTVERHLSKTGRGVYALVYFRGWLVQYIRALDMWLLEDAVCEWVQTHEFDPEIYALPAAPARPFVPVQKAAPDSRPSSLPDMPAESTETGISGAMTDAFDCWPVLSGLRFILRAFGDTPAEFEAAGLPGHDGVDLPARSGADVVAPIAGNVSAVVYLPDFGWVVRLNSGLRMGNTVAQVSINLGPLAQISINPFAPVEAGDGLGQVGDDCTLHLSVARHNAPAYVDKSGVWPAGIFDPTPLLLPLMGGENAA